jgi:ankyrin repeat protein
MKKSTIFLQILLCLLLFSAKVAAAQEVSRSQKCQAATKLERAFLAAVEAGKIATVKALLNKGISAETKDSCHDTALMLAVRNNHTPIVDLLLRAGADADAVDIFHQNTLIQAFDDTDDDASDKKQEDNFMLVKALIDAGADVNFTKDFGSYTAVILATKANRIKSLELLLKAGAEVNVQDTYDKTALSYASERGYSEAKALLKSFGANATEAIEWYKEKYGDNAFIQATTEGRADVVEEMLENGFQVNTQNAAGVTALMRVRNISTLKALLNAGANVHLRDNAGFTALIHVSASWSAKMVQGLIQAGADIEAKTPDGKTALMFASLQGDVSAVQALLDAGAKVNERDASNKTALSHALTRDKSDVIKLLRQAGGVQ